MSNNDLSMKNGGLDQAAIFSDRRRFLSNLAGVKGAALAGGALGLDPTLAG